MKGKIVSLGLADANHYVNKSLLYSTGNYIQYSVTNHDGKENMYICITESFCCTAKNKDNNVNQLIVQQIFLSYLKNAAK